MIKLEECSVQWKEQQLLSSINLHVYEGDFFCLIGESGGGKTLLSRLMLGWLPKGFEVSGTISAKQDKMEIILQNPIGSMQANSKVGTQFHHLLKSKGIKEKRRREQQMMQILASVGFSNMGEILNKRPFQLSGGMCQKIAIAMALISQPEIIIADEPTSALDAESQQNMMTLLWNIYRERGLTIVLITHNLNMVREYGTHVGIVKEGRLIEAGTTRQVLTNPQEKYTQELIEIFER